MDAKDAALFNVCHAFKPGPGILSRLTRPTSQAILLTCQPCLKLNSTLRALPATRYGNIFMKEPHILGGKAQAGRHALQAL